MCHFHIKNPHSCCLVTKIHPSCPDFYILILLLQGLVRKMSTSTCECSCEPCPDGTKLCPTSELCLPLEKWCDGLQDCGDDERDCVSSTAVWTTVTEPTIISTAVPTAGATPGTTTQIPIRKHVYHHHQLTVCLYVWGSERTLS